MAARRAAIGALAALAALGLVAGTVRAAPGIAGMGRLRTGIASWYGGRFEGRLMANGCAFRAGSLSAASISLPLGALVLVRRLQSPLWVVVPVTDRGPYVTGRVIDLSRAAAARLDMLAAGLVAVSIEPLDRRLLRGCAQ